MAGFRHKQRAREVWAPKVMSSVAATVHSERNMNGWDMQTTTRVTKPLRVTLWTTTVIWMTLCRYRSKQLKRQKRPGEQRSDLEDKTGFHTLKLIFQKLIKRQRKIWRRNLREELAQFDQFRISRCIRVDIDVRDVTIHTLCDASEKAYVAATYTGHEYEDDSVSSQLVAAKTR